MRPSFPGTFPAMVRPRTLDPGDRIVTTEHAVGASATVIPTCAEPADVDGRLEDLFTIGRGMDPDVRWWVMGEDGHVNRI